MKQYSVIWTMGILAATAEDAAKQAREGLLDPNCAATYFHVRPDVDSTTVADSELQDRGYRCIDADPTGEAYSVAANIQSLLCAPWSKPEQADYVIPAFLLKHRSI